MKRKYILRLRNQRQLCRKTKIGETPKIPETETPDNVDLKSKKSSFLLSAIPERIRKCIANLKVRDSQNFPKVQKIARKFRQGKKQWETILTFIRDEENKKLSAWPNGRFLLSSGMYCRKTGRKKFILALVIRIRPARFSPGSARFMDCMAGMFRCARILWSHAWMEN